MTVDPALQAEVDSQLMEQGAYAALEMLFNTGRLVGGDYESWRRREIELLDGVLMGNKDKIRAQLEQAAGYARKIGLVEQAQEFNAWHSQASTGGSLQLRASGDATLHRLIVSRYVPAQSIPQMDLFFDNPVVVLTNGIVHSLTSRNAVEARRQLDRLYSLAPNHADLGAFDRLLSALEDPHQVSGDPRQSLEFLLGITPSAKRLLGSQSRDLLAPLWRQLADAVGDRAFDPAEPTLHRSFVLKQAQDWPGVAASVLNEPQWWRHAELCLNMALSGFYGHRRIDSLIGWSHLCWRHPERASSVLDSAKQPDPGITAWWRRFIDSDEDADIDSPAALTASDFPAWMLLQEQGLTLHLAADLPTGETPGEDHYRCVHRWIQARRSGNRDDEMAQRKILQRTHPGLFRLLKGSV